LSKRLKVIKPQYFEQIYKNILKKVEPELTQTQEDQ
jgi:hypothetical protein